jgi:hypothetical protein
MQGHIRLGRIFGVDIGFHYSWFIITLSIMFWLGGVADIEQEAVDPKTKLLMGIKDKTCAAGVLGASAMICRGLYPPLPQRV